MKVSNHFQETVKAYLDERAQTDELFAASYAKENKSIKECCDYILGEVQKSGCSGFADEEIFSMAVHYYDEDDIKVGKASDCHVVVNHTVELTEEEKLQARQEAMNKAIEEQRALLKKKPVKPKKEEEKEVKQMSLF